MSIMSAKKKQVSYLLGHSGEGSVLCCDSVVGAFQSGKEARILAVPIFTKHLFSSETFSLGKGKEGL